MFPLKSQLDAQPESETYPLGQKSDHSQDGPAMALVALSHTPVEHRIFLALLSMDSEDDAARRTFTACQLMGLEGTKRSYSFERALRRLADNRTLSRREVQVALCCIEGMTNAAIGKRLQVSEQTVKFHLRHIFMKFRVKRRAELISRLLM